MIHRVRWTEAFLCAGSSALLISAAHLYPELRFVSLFALVPFLWRAIRASLIESMVLGGLLALSYAFIAIRPESWASPGTLILTVVGLVVLFALYGAAVNRIKTRIGFNAIFIAALWLPLEYFLSEYANLEYLFAIATDESGFLLRIGSLFGMLTIPFVVVLINSLILVVLRQIVRVLLSCDRHPIPEKQRTSPPFKEITYERRWYCYPDVRAPPRVAH